MNIFKKIKESKKYVLDKKYDMFFKTKRKLKNSFKLIKIYSSLLFNQISKYNTNIKSLFSSTYSFIANFVSIYLWYPSYISFILTCSLSASIIYISKGVHRYIIDDNVREIIIYNIHAFFMSLFGVILSIILFVGSSSGRDSSFDRSRVLFKTSMLFPLIIFSIINVMLSFIVSPENLIFSCVILISFTLFSMIKLFDSMLNRQQFNNQRKIISENSIEILWPILTAPQNILRSELFAFAAECHIHLSSGNITFAQSSVENLNDLTSRIKVNMKNMSSGSRKYKVITSFYTESIALNNQILLSSLEVNQIEVFKTASYSIKSSVFCYSTDDVGLSKFLLRNISKHGFLLFENIKLRKYLWEALVVCDKHSFLDTAYIQIINNCHKENYETSVGLVENILSEASECIRFCIETEDLKNFQMIKNTIKYIAQNGFDYPQCLSRSAEKLREESRSLAKQHMLGMLVWMLSKEKSNYGIHFFEFLQTIPKEVSALWQIFEDIIKRKNEEDFIWTSIGIWMEGSGSWSGSLHENGYFRTIIILIFFIDPQIKEEFLFPKKILPDLLVVTDDLKNNYPSKIFRNDTAELKEFFSFTTKFKSVIEKQQSQ